MALTICPECGKEISDKAKICPHCGYNIENANVQKNVTDIKCELKYLLKNDKIYFLILSYNITNSTFIRNMNKFILCIQYCGLSGINYNIKLLLYSLESYISFLFDGFNNNIRKNNDILLIRIDVSKEVQQWIQIKYDDLPDEFLISKKYNNNIGEIEININLPKEKLFNISTKKRKKESKEIQEDIKINKPVLQTKRIAEMNNEIISHKSDISKVGITAIVLNDNRKCTNEHYFIQDIQAELRIATPTNGIVLHKIPAAYCESCDLYFVIKSDFKKLQTLGKILCPVIDRTQKHLNKITKRKAGGESRIHQLGYNVKKGNECTDEQRQMILANIVENTNISKYEITSLISKCIAQHKTQDNYVNSVKCWQHDLKFISNYNLGDMPEVIIEKLIIGKRK